MINIFLVAFCILNLYLFIFNIVVTFETIHKIRQAFSEVHDDEKVFFYESIKSKCSYAEKELSNIKLKESDLYSLDDKEYLCKVSFINNKFEECIEKIVYPFVNINENYFLSGQIFFIKLEKEFLIGTAADQRYISFNAVINDKHVYISLIKKLNCLKHL